MKDTAIYGVSSIVGRFLNWCLVPMYTICFPVAEYGVVTYVYAVTALALIVLTYGMETGFFRFANHDRWKDPMLVYSTSLTSLAVTSALFCILVAAFIEPVTRWMECDGHEEYVLIMALCVAVDAFTALPFSYLRYKKRPVRFAFLKLVNIGINIGLNLFFILACPALYKTCPALVDWFYNPEFGIGYIFLANLIASLVMLAMLWPELHGFRWRFDGRLLKRMLAYSAPLLVLGVAGVLNQTIATILYPSLVPDHAEAMQGLGIYGANYKIAIVMVMFIQAFRFAYEPFIFAEARENGEKRMQAYRDAMKYFIVFALFIFMAVMFYLDIIKFFISPRYFSGLKVVPVIMMAEVFFGIFFNLSLWYKLTDKTVWGMYFSLLGLAVTIGLNAVLVPRYGYMGCAWAAFACYAVMMLASFFAGNTRYPIGYPLTRIGAYFVTAAALYVLGMYVAVTPVMWINWTIRAMLLAAYVLLIARHEKIHLPSPAQLLHRGATK